MNSLDLSQFKKNISQHQGHEESDEGWLVSYADLITLLFIFFAVMLSMSTISKVKVQFFSEQIRQESTSSLSQFKKEIEEEIKKEKLDEHIRTSFDQEGLQIQFSERILFPSGEAQINSEGRELLKKVAEMLKKIDSQYSIAVIGHSDDRPIHTRQFSSNWDLSSKRSVNVLHFFSERGVNEKSLMVRAHASNHPLFPIDQNHGLSLEAARAQNRRVTVLVF